MILPLVLKLLLAIADGTGYWKYVNTHLLSSYVSSRHFKLGVVRARILGQANL